MRDVIEARLRQLQTERAQVAQTTEQAAAQAESGRRLLAAYDGAIGELSALLATAAPPAASATAEDETG